MSSNQVRPDILLPNHEETDTCQSARAGELESTR